MTEKSGQERGKLPDSPSFPHWVEGERTLDPLLLTALPC